MSLDLGSLFRKALKDERKVLRPYFFPAGDGTGALVTEESYLRLRLSRMFLKNRRVLFQTKYPVVNSLVRFAGIDGIVEVAYVAKPDLAGDSNESRLDDIVVLDQTVLGPVLWRGGDLELMLGLYAAPADDWAQRFISLAEGVSQLTLNATLSTAISVAGTIKSSLENSLGGDGLDLKLGLDKELKENDWLVPGSMVMIAAPDDTIDERNLQIEDGELKTKQGKVYTDHDYMVLSIEVTDQRSDWMSLGYGNQWQTMLNTAAQADDKQQVRDAYQTFTGAILASLDLSWTDRNRIVAAAQKRITDIRKARANTDFLDALEGMGAAGEVARLVAAQVELPDKPVVRQSPADLLQTGWLD